MPPRAFQGVPGEDVLVQTLVRHMGVLLVVEWRSIDCDVIRVQILSYQCKYLVTLNQRN